MHQMDRRQSTIRLSDDAVDQNGVARFSDSGWQMPLNENSEIAPWIDEPPTPPPKSTSSRSFGLAQKSSFSFMSMRQNSASNLLRPTRPSESTLDIPDAKRRSQDDSESSKGLVYSGSSTHSGDLRKARSAMNIFHKLKTRTSKTHLRSDSDGSEQHPSLKPPVPPLPEQRHTNPLFNAGPLTLPGASISTISIPPSKKSGRDSKGKKRANANNKVLPTPPPKNDDGQQEFTGDLNLDSMEGILDPKIVSAGSSSGLTNGSAGRDPSSPSSGFDSAQSYSDHSSSNYHYFVPPSEFSDPFSTTSIHDKRKGVFPGDYRKVSPKTIMPPRSGSYQPSEHGSTATSVTLGPGSPTWPHFESWVPPESWAVKGTEEDENLLGSAHPDSDTDASFTSFFPALNGRKGTADKIKNGKRSRNPASASFSSVASTTSRTSRSTLRGSHQYPYGFAFKMRVYRQQASTYHVVQTDLNTTVADLTLKLNKKLFNEDKDRLTHNLYLKEQGRERMLGHHERPGAIIKLRMEQAGYDIEDGHHLLGYENLGVLLSFVYKSQLLAGEEQFVLDNYAYVDLSGRGLRTIPVVLHQNADSIVSLRLDRNPMLEIPLDFIQSCTILRELRLTNMSMKKVPTSLRHSSTLHRLHLSSNCIRDIEDAYLDQIHGLLTLALQNNRLERLPWHFPRLKSLVTLNISNNKFREFPIVVTQLESLHDLDISFNMITELPEEIGKMNALERLIIVGNRVTKFPPECVNLVNLRTLDCRRNQISDLSRICLLPNLAELSADHNVVHALELSLGPHLTTLIASHNDITQLSLVPGPMGTPYGLTLLDLSYAKLSYLDDLTLSQLTSLRTLKLDHNSIRSIPDSLGELMWLEALSCTDNKLDALPSTIGRLQKLETLDAHNNSLTELPQTLWSCASLWKINVTSNFIGSWHDPPVVVQEHPSLDGSLTVPGVGRKPSIASIASTRAVPSLVYSLAELYLGENCLTDNVIQPLMIFRNLRVLNLSFNEIQDMPPNFFCNMIKLQELYLSGNKLTSIPSEDFPRLAKLTTLYLNGNKLHNLPQELGKVKNLRVLDVGSNLLKYNINNWEFDWNWNFNTNLKYLNLSGNKRLQIKADPMRNNRHSSSHPTMLSGFTSLSQLRVLGLMDVTITTTAKDTTVDIPDENTDRRIRTSLSTVCGMGYGIADSLGKNDHLNMIDLVHEFHGRKDEAIFAMFGRTHLTRPMKPGSTPNKLSKFLHDNFVNVFMTQLAAINVKQEKEGVPLDQRKEGIPKALHWTFLKLNQDLREYISVAPRKNSHASMQAIYESQYSVMGASGIALYFVDKTIYAANVGDALAVVSRQGVCHEISRKHDPYDRLETARIRAAEGFLSPPGLVNDEVEVSRSFGYYHLFPPLNARPDIFTYNLTEMDEFVIIANRGLWDYVPYQTAVDIARTVARTERPDPMLAAQKLRDFAISYGADGSTMIMVIWVADLFNSPSRSRQPTLDPIVDPQMYRPRRKGEVRDHTLDRLDGEVPPPTGHVTLVFTDIRNSTHLWEANPGMPTAMRLHNNLLRRQLRFCGGYEVKTEGDSFMCSFPTTLAAVWWCLNVQVQLVHESWPLEILECEDGKPIYDADGRLIARGLSVRMGIHSGMPLCETDLITHRMDYFGPMVNRSARINSSALGGQIMCSMDIIREINAKVLEVDEETEFSKLQSPQAVEAVRRMGVVIMPVGEVKLKGIELPEILSVLYPSGLEGRHELKEAPVDPTTSGSRVPFSVPQIRELGLLCLRFEALSSGRVFKPLPDRKGSIQSNPDLDESSSGSMTLYGDPNLLLPSIHDKSSDTDLMLVLDALTLRINNAANTVYQQFNIAPPCEQPSRSNQMLYSALEQDGVLSPETLAYIASMVERLR